VDTLTWDVGIAVGKLLLSWPVVVLFVVLVFRKRLESVLDELIERVRRAPKIKVAGIYEDEGVRAVAAVVKEQIIEAAPAPTAVAADARFETRRDTIIRVAAEKAKEAFGRWHQDQLAAGRRFPDRSMALLTWVLEVGAPTVFRSYEVFKLVHATVTLVQGEEGPPVPSKDYFENMVKGFDRDHPHQR
jgi:hypothetical protein